MPHNRFNNTPFPVTGLCLALLFTLLLSSGIEARQEQIQIQVHDSVLVQLPDSFFGIQYHRNSYDEPALLNQLSKLPVKTVRVWAYPRLIRPDTTSWDWTEMDRKIQEITTAGYEPVICIFQAEDWYTGTPQDPWWNQTTAVEEWLEVADSVTQRYAGQFKYLILFDELNYLHPDNPYYISFSQAADLYLQTASRVKSRHPSLKVGGPSGFSGWENGHWANYVFTQTEHDTLLDFISSNIFLSWNKDDTDAQIMDRTIWYEEAPKKIRSMLNSEHRPELMLDAYNASALWTIDGSKDGELWTDPRNVNAFGGVYQTLAILHAAKGGFDRTLRWETLGGFGIFDWYPNFNPLPTYHAWELLTSAGGLQPGSELRNIQTTADALVGLPHHSGMNSSGYAVQPFAVHNPSEDILSVILVNKYDSTQSVQVATPTGMNGYRKYWFSESRIEEATIPVDSGNTAQLTLDLPPVSVTVVQYSPNLITGTDEPLFSELPRQPELRQNYPNPFNPATTIRFSLPRALTVALEVFTISGQKVAQLYQGTLPAGEHAFTFEAGGYPSGVYFYRLQTPRATEIRKMILLK